jgi:hypothetical protein
MVGYAVLVAALVLSALLLRAVAFGYPPPQLPRGAMFSRKEQAVVAAAADALFPPKGPIPLSGTEAGLVPYMDAYVAGLPPLPRMLGRLLFHSVEHAPLVWGPRRVRFTRLRPEERIQALKEMQESELYFRRVSFLSMRAMMTMGYLASPAVAREMRMVASLAPFEARKAEKAAEEEVSA